ncbi:MAG: DUF2304 domain-containing protein [Candidatus Binatia bacterium]
MDIMITVHQRVFAVLASIAVFLLIVELVRRRRLREEYSWLWLLTGVGMIVLVVWYRLLLFVTWMIGAGTPVTTLFLFSSLFLLVIAIHYSVIISRLTTQVKNLAQELALLASQVERHRDS